ncbi:MAG: tetratricopeptide repeat protein [Thermoanaerobaculia bacterium]
MSSAVHKLRTPFPVHIPAWVVALALAGLVAAPVPVSGQAPAEDAPAPSDAPADPAPPDAPAGAPSAASAYQFGLAKLLMDEGDYRQAQEAFERALEVDPSAAYVRLEYAELLARLGRYNRSQEARLAQLEEAVAQARQAQQALPDNVDALRVLAETHLALASEAPGDAEPMAAAVAALERVRELEAGDVRSLIQLGQIYLRRGEAEAAAEVFQDVVRETPGYRPVYRMLAEALLQSGQKDAAAEALREVLEGEPEAESARVSLAEILAEQGDHAGAAEVLQQAPAPLESTDARTRLATELYLSGDLDASLRELDALAADVPDSRYVQLLRGLVLSAQARNEEALATLEPLVGDGPGEADLAVTVSELLLRQEREEEAVDLLSRTVRRLESQESSGDEAVDARLALARLYAGLDRWAEVEATVAPVLEEGIAGQQGLEAVLLQSDALVEQGRGEAALDSLERAGAAAAGTGQDSGAEARAPVQAQLEAKRAELLARLGRDGEALAILMAAAGDEPPEAFLDVVEALHRADRFEETIPALRDFIADRPESTPGRFLLAAAQERAGRRGEAEETLSALVADQPDFHPALNYLGYMWIEEGENLDRAMELVDRAVKLDPDNGAYIDSLGWGYYQLGRYEDAREALERAARLVQDPTIYEHLGDVYAALGRPEEARRAYRRAVELEADDPEAVERKLSALEERAGGAPREIPQP